MSEELKKAFDDRWGDAIAATHIKALAWEYFQCGWCRRQEIAMKQTTGEDAPLSVKLAIEKIKADRDALVEALESAEKELKQYDEMAKLDIDRGYCELIASIKEAKPRFEKPKKLGFVPCDEHGQETKPLTVEQLQKIVIAQYGSEPGNWMDHQSFEDCSWETAQAIHAALPPDQSGRIAELESEVEEQRLRIVMLRMCDHLESQIVQLTNSLESANDRIERALKVIKDKWKGYADTPFIDTVSMLHAIEEILKGEDK